MNTQSVLYKFEKTLAEKIRGVIADIIRSNYFISSSYIL